ncbi:TIGR03086 family metal-binding protein [Nakamurella leprariae]|uniref:TIGR03086 family protein n=1 Tax=Nakamurella leprariae TaxID=2803911 RepID=A0A938YBL5_9ACTN|nr:TIGR03086 family metal-binding protein [Nakamurella leprariae]MBM9469500.1 TIGR03086 family protein [Nakamurella leprariae]
MTESRPAWAADPDLHPAAQAIAEVAAGITDDQLTGPTPCAQYRVGDLLDHVMGLSVAFTVAADRTDDPALRAELQQESVQGQATLEHLDPHWRQLLPGRLQRLARAWDDPAAWDGSGEAGGVTMPGGVAGRVATQELVLHGWDLAAATGQPYAVDPQHAALLHHMTQEATAPDQRAMRDTIFGPEVPVPGDASEFDRALGLSGRDPGWRPPA